ncbi:MAG: hypothetical protein EOP37_15300 [Rubrivivax sp.]|nr:MAG: hypothetical protein EOP37_15300 [Rubrivivax sp.]
MELRELTLEELELVSGGISDALLSDIGKGALAGGFAGFAVTGGTPIGFLGGAALGAAGGAVYHYWVAQQAH